MYNYFYNNCKFLVIVVNKNGFIKFMNKSALNFFNNLSKNIKELIPLYELNKQEEVRYNDTLLKIYKKKFFFNYVLFINPIHNYLVYKDFFEYSNHIMCLTNKEGKFLNVNYHMLEILDYEKEDIIGKSLFLFIHPDDLEKTHKEVENLNNSIDTINFYNRYRKKNGEYIYLYWRGKVIENKIYGFAIDVSDILKNKEKLHVSKNFLEITEDLILSGTWSWGVKTGELIWSDGLKKIYGIDKVSYEEYLKANHPDDLVYIKNTINQCLIDKIPYKMEHRLINQKTRELKYIRASGLYIEKGYEKNPYILGVVQDITHEKKIIDNLVLLKEKAEESNKIKSSFVANVSHELRTPLNGIIGIAQLLKNTKNLSEKQKEYISILNNSCDLLMSIINNILDFSKIEKQEINFSNNPINIKKFIEENVKIYEYNAVMKKLYFVLKISIEDTEIITDEMKLKQILYNILSNSIKFTNNGGITIDVYKKQNYIFIDIKDTGVGMEQEEQKNIFRPFFQGNKSDKTYQGSGLGLAISKFYAESLNIKLSFVSTLSLGTNFTLKIPFSKDCEKDQFKKSIYIIEDNFANQYILKEILYDILPGFNIVSYQDPCKALKNINIENDPLLIFMDIHMPGMDGYVCSANLKKKGITCPIIAITAGLLDYDNIDYKCMDDFIQKPFSRSTIKKILQKYLE